VIFFIFNTFDWWLMLAPHHLAGRIRLEPWDFKRKGLFDKNSLFESG